MPPGVRVQVDGVSKLFVAEGGHAAQALDSIDLEVRDKEFCCVVGPSGCGKTTLLRIIAGLEPLTSGRISVRQTDPTRPVNAMLFQEQSIFPWLTVTQNIEYGLKTRGIRGTQRSEIVRFWLEKVHLTKFAHAYPYQLSGGMKQRVSIARSLAREPELLLMDEPFGGLDEQTKLRLQDELLRIWSGTNTTVIFITHSIDEAVLLGDRVVVMSAHPGRVIAEIPVDLARPRDVVALKADPHFGALVGQVWTLLKTEVDGLAERERGRSVISVDAAAPPAARPASPHGVTADRFWQARQRDPAQGRERTIERLAATTAPIVLLLVWQIVSTNNLIDRRFFPAPTTLFESLLSIEVLKRMLEDTSITLGRVAIGFALGATPALLLGMAAGMSRIVRSAIRPLVAILYPIPKIAILPLLILIFGLGDMSKYVVVAIGVFFPIALNTINGFLSIDRIYLDVGANVGAGPTRTFFTIGIPGALPSILTGVRIAMGTGLLVAIAAEFVGSQSGLGYRIWFGWQTFQVETMYQGLIAVSILGLLLFEAVQQLDGRLLRWRGRR